MGKERQTCSQIDNLKKSISIQCNNWVDRAGFNVYRRQDNGDLERTSREIKINSEELREERCKVENLIGK